MSMLAISAGYYANDSTPAVATMTSVSGLANGTYTDNPAGVYWGAGKQYGFDLGSAKEVTSIRVYSSAHGGTTWYNSTYDDIDVYYSSDNENWTLLESFSGIDDSITITEESDHCWFELQFSTRTSARYWKVYSSSGVAFGAGGASAIVSELEAYVVDTTLSGPVSSCGEVNAVSASSIYSSSYPASEGFDGNTSDRESNRWVSLNSYNESTGLPDSGDGEWYQFEFASALTVASVRVMVGNCEERAPRKITFYVSDTGAFSGEETSCGQVDYGATEPSENAWTDSYAVPTPTAGKYFRMVINQLWASTAGYVIVPEWEVTLSSAVAAAGIFIPSLGAKISKPINSFNLLGGI